MLNIAY